jgi:hypothetical protein
MSYEWDVIRTTTDKLSETLNDLAWDVHQIEFTGGRDWVVIQRRKTVVPELEAYRGFAEHAKGSRFWEITIPSMGPNDEPLITQAKRAIDIEQAAKEAIAVTYDMDVRDIEVDISIDTSPR